MKIKVLAFFLMAALACGCSNAKRAEQRVVESVNGKVYYIINNNGEVAFVVKDGYNNADFGVMLYHDSVTVGKEFGAIINVPKDNFTVTISKPEYYSYTRADVKNHYEYKFKTTQTGTFEFAGVIEFDTVRVPFEYKFFVKDELSH